MHITDSLNFTQTQPSFPCDRLYYLACNSFSINYTGPAFSSDMLNAGHILILLNTCNSFSVCFTGAGLVTSTCASYSMISLYFPGNQVLPWFAINASHSVAGIITPLIIGKAVMCRW